MNVRLITMAALGGCLLSGSTLGQGRLLVVDDDPSPSVFFNDIQPAVDVAREGDGILVRAGTYSNFTVDGKSLAIVGEGQVEVDANPFKSGEGIEIRGLGANQWSLVQGIDIVQTQPGFYIAGVWTGMEVTNNEGPVWIEDVASWTGEATAAISVVNSDAVTLVDCIGRPTRPGACGLILTNSNAAVYRSEFEGAEGDSNSGYYGTCLDGVDGAPGLGAKNSTAFVQRSHFIGGRGGDGHGLITSGAPFYPAQGTHGGDAVQLNASTFTWTASTFVPGQAGAPITNCLPQPLAGEPLTPGPASNYERPGTPRSVTATPLVRESQTITLDFEGESGDFVALAASWQPTFGDLLPFVGPLLVGTPSVAFTFGVLPTAGTLTRQARTAIPPGHDYEVLYLQPALRDASGGLHLGAPSALVVLRDHF